MAIALRQSTASQEVAHSPSMRVPAILPAHVSILASFGAILSAWSSWRPWFCDKIQAAIEAFNYNAIYTSGVWIRSKFQMVQRMSGARYYFKIFRSIIQFIAVNVMNNLRFIERSTDLLAHNVPVFKYISTFPGIFMLWIGYQNVTLSGQGFTTSPMTVIFTTAIMSMYYKSRCSTSPVSPQSSSAWSKFSATSAFANHFAISFVDSITQSERNVKTGVLNVYSS